MESDRNMVAEKKRSSLLKYILLVSVFAVSAVGLFFYLTKEKSNIYDFDYARDAKEILDIFDKDWYWLVAHLTPEEYSADFMLKNRAYDQNPANFGKLIIKVAREGDKLAGFTAYFKRRFFEGFLLYLGVVRDFRRKGYGKKLMLYAINDLFNKGCSVIRLLTRTDNVARKLYEKLGFKLYHEEPGFVYYEKYKK